MRQMKRSETKTRVPLSNSHVYLWILQNSGITTTLDFVVKNLMSRTVQPTNKENRTDSHNLVWLCDSNPEHFQWKLHMQSRQRTHFLNCIDIKIFSSCFFSKHALMINLALIFNIHSCRLTSGAQKISWLCDKWKEAKLKQVCPFWTVLFIFEFCKIQG